MSLDVYLYRKRWTSYNEGKTFKKDLEEVYSGNITHNLGTMAEQAGIYKALWRPEEINAKKASDIYTTIKIGLKKLKTEFKYFETFNPDNGWGSYEGLVKFVEDYAKACKKYPNAIIKVSR